MIEEIVQIKNYTVYLDTIRHNYKICKGSKIISYPSTLEDAMSRIESLTGIVKMSYCNGCKNGDCHNCERDW
jgi:hypothetical protein